jgi:hypothetical protein
MPPPYPWLQIKDDLSRLLYKDLQYNRDLLTFSRTICLLYIRQYNQLYNSLTRNLYNSLMYKVYQKLNLKWLPLIL